MNRFNTVADKGITQRLDDRNATSHRCLEENRYLVHACQGKDLGSPFGEKRLVPCYNNTTGADSCGCQFKGLRGSPDQFRDNADLGIIQKILPTVREK